MRIPCQSLCRALLAGRRWFRGQCIISGALYYGIMAERRKDLSLERNERAIPNGRALERELEGLLIRVRIQDRGRRGKITFEYGSLE